MCAGGTNGGIVPPEIRVMLAASLLAPDPPSFGLATVAGAESPVSWALIWVLVHWGACGCQWQVASNALAFGKARSHGEIERTGYADNGATVGLVSGGLPPPESATGVARRATA